MCIRDRYIPGSFNLLADALSRMPVLNRFSREEMEEHNEIEEHMANLEEHTEVYMSNATAEGYELEDISLNRFFEAAKIDKDYQEIMSELKRGTKYGDLKENHPAREFKKSWDELEIFERNGESIMTKNGTIIVVPKMERKFCLTKLHMPHMGYRNTSQTARSIYYWPTICADIANLTSSCKACLEDNPSRQKEPGKEHNVEPLNKMEPMDEVSADLFNLYGKDYLVMVDRATSYPWVRKIKNQSSAELVSKVDEIFLEAVSYTHLTLPTKRIV